MPARPLVVGVDSSTQSVKVEARDLATGAVVATGTAKHPPTTPPVSEQDPRAWWDALVAACAQLGDHRRDVVAISVAGQQHGLVLLDAAGEPVRPAKLWNDTTSAPNAERLVASSAPAAGPPPRAACRWPRSPSPSSPGSPSTNPTCSPARPSSCCPHDYLTWRLTGRHVTDRGDASGTGWYDAATGDYLCDLFKAATDDTWDGALPHVLGPTEAAGTLTADAAAALGPARRAWSSGRAPATTWAPRSGSACGRAMSRCRSARRARCSPCRPPPPATSSGLVAGFASASGSFLPLVCTLNATKVTDTVARWLGTDATGLAALALAAADDPGSPTLVPYFDGERTPNRPDATGTFAGLTNATTREQLALAAHDGVLCGLLDGQDALREVGASMDGRLFLVGGGARSAAYRQRAADLTGAAVTVPHTDETVATGAAAQAAAVCSGDDLARSPTVGRSAPATWSNRATTRPTSATATRPAADSPSLPSADVG